MIKKWKNTRKQIHTRGKIFTYYEVEAENQEGNLRGTFDLLEFGSWVNIIALDKQDRMILVEQYRIGSDQVMLEIPGGAIDQGEAPLEGAKRELLEETGYVSEEWVELGKVDPNPAFMNNTCYTYLAKNCVDTGKQNLDHLEEIELKFVPVEDRYSLIQKEKITHSLIVSAFYFYDQYLRN
jgi:8-oxo-dGTP pyrophosphatase MutT (NUDIX family)